MKNRRILITGSKGYIGEHLTRRLDQEKISWFGLDYKGGQDILNPASFPLEKSDDIIHLAGISDRNQSILHPDIVFKTNFQTTLNVLENARLNGSRVIFMSSSLIYKPNADKISENDALDPSDPYSFSKRICEDLSNFYHVKYNIPVVIIRLFNVYGKKLKKNTLFSDLIEQIINNKTEIIKLQNNSSIRDYIHIDDVIHAIMLILKSSIIGTFNLGSGKGYKPKDIANIIMKAVGLKKEIEVCNDDESDGHFYSNSSKIENALNYHPKITILEGIKELIEIYDKNM